MNVRSLIVLLLLAFVVFALGMGLGILYQGQKSPVKNQAEAPALPDAVKVLSSNIVPSITARGKVSKIDGTNVTLVFRADSRVIPITSDARVYALTLAPVSPTNKSKYINKEAAFKDIKVGDNLEVAIRVLPTGQIEGFNIIILPATIKTPTPTPAPAK